MSKIMKENHEINHDQSKTSNFVQWIATFAVFLLALQVGIGIGWASPNNARLLKDDSPIHATTDDISWMTSLVSIGAAIGAILGAIAVEIAGSRRTILLTYALLSISWILLLVSNSVEWLYASRFIMGIGCTLLYCCFSLYLGEISDARIRGSLISLAIIGSPFGCVLGIIAETYLDMKVTASIYLVLGLIGILLFFWLDDTPYYLIKKNERDTALISINFYRGTSSEKELDEVISFVENSADLKEKLNMLKVSVVRKSIFMIMLVFTLPHIAGYMNLMSYMQTILESSKFDLIKPEECVIYANIITVITAFVTFNLIDKLGRKILLIISSIGTASALVALGTHFYLLKSEFDVENLQWLPVGSILFYLITYSVGYGSVPGALLSEMFPENIKSVAACAATLSVSFFGFIVAKAYQPIIDSVGEAYAFWIHAVLALLGVPCALFMIIETKGKTFQEIQDKLMKGQ
ncbi:facilitated trehalose transporter Tret1-like [Phymastichus coffea]|uniref:facilitated trehalose transporter Tret1-like n=1 Tax=Phymastichus coffea TaxID=108790 RepID=UPI00273B08F2|nr:facilitated trehalose transporter Tret1-like [Phymastichus coffea]XP_058807158.1 facilitated trehalose transporter Tret1-like [Phymastichus coffea]XP_058807159.1 facilitated trehalose transporter Tret1-like [Phymastichus coffea]XP_058807161.1 facilitated trehalose transporter Tret1-like [Phymastichus coffea]XP_058807162.1 facilitated trehalose transporter Tret1-like [Phymastichus coffea]XP_058807163.1 facilitated trehalose transporter Tret1-like [Phymastichus coffea]